MVADQDLALYSDTNRTFQIDDRTLISQLYCFLLEGKKTAYSGFFRGSGPNTCAVFFRGSDPNACPVFFEGRFRITSTGSCKGGVRAVFISLAI